MAYVYPGAGAPEDAACRYGASRLLFRGPQRDVRGPYCVVLGGTETYGRYVARLSRRIKRRDTCRVRLRSSS